MFGVVSFSGDQDSKIPLTQTRIIANNLAKDLNLVPFTKYGTWYDKKQVCKPPNKVVPQGIEYHIPHRIEEKLSGIIYVWVSLNL